MGARIFISYSSKDQKIAETICRALEARSYECWIACRNVGPGENFQEAIVKALRSSQLMLLVFTSNANNSDEIKKEVVLAGRHHVTVVPVRVEDVAPNDALAYEFATRQWIDLFDDWERHIDRLVTQIGNIISGASTGSAGEKNVVAQPTLPPPSPNMSLRPATLAALAVLLLVGLSGGGYLYMRTEPQPAAAPSTTPATAQAASAEASDETAWQNAASAATLQAYRQYADSFPNGAHVAAARQRIQAADDRAWTDASGEGTLVSLKQYLGQFPAGAHAADVRSQIASLEQASGEGTQRFDGGWQGTVVCSNAGSYEGYTISVTGQVKDNVFHAEYGVESQPGWLSIDGTIQADGSAELHAQGRTGRTSGLTPNTPYGYTILAKFSGSSGNGARKEQRPCTFTAFRH